MFSMYGEGGNSGVEITTPLFINPMVIEQNVWVNVVQSNTNLLPPHRWSASPGAAPGGCPGGSPRASPRRGRELVDQNQQRLRVGDGRRRQVEAAKRVYRQRCVRPRSSLYTLSISLKLLRRFAMTSGGAPELSASVSRCANRKTSSGSRSKLETDGPKRFSGSGAGRRPRRSSESLRYFA